MLFLQHVLPILRLTNALRQVDFYCWYIAFTALYTLSLHDALPIYSFKNAAARSGTSSARFLSGGRLIVTTFNLPPLRKDRKSTRLNSSHVAISYAVFCLKKKNANSYCYT